MTDKEFLIWIHARLVHVHGENENMDYMHHLRSIIGNMPKNKTSASICMPTRGEMKKYWAEEKEDGKIEVVCSGDTRIALSEGKASQFYEFDYPTAKQRYSAEYPDADIWYTERNGDPITMLVPKGTTVDRLPTRAMDYMVFEWIDPDNEFGTGVKVT